MKLPRDLSGSELVKALCKHYGYVRIHHEGAILSCRQSDRYPSIILLARRSMLLLTLACKHADAARPRRANSDIAPRNRDHTRPRTRPEFRNRHSPPGRA